MKTKALVENRLNEIFARQDSLTRAWTPFLESVNGFMKKAYDRELTIHERRNIAQCLENSIIDSGVRSRGRLFEATTEDNIDFLGVQLPVIAALLPTLVLNEIATVQALDRRTGSVFFLDVKAGSTKGSVTAGDSLINSKTGQNSSEGARRYAEARVEGEVVAVSNGAVGGTVAYAPGLIRLDEALVKDSDGNTIGVVSSAGVVTANGTGATATGQINVNGTYTLTISNLSSTKTASLTYFYQYDLPKDSYDNRDGVPEVDVAVTSEAVTATDYTLRSKYSLGAALDLQKAHGINLENELVKYLGGEVKFAIDQTGLDLIDAAATGTGCATAPTAWDATIQSGQEWLWKKYELLDRFEEGSNNIWAKTLRAVATFIHCGNNVARVLRQMPEFKAAGGLGKTPPTGPVVIGDINGRKVVQNPWKNTNKYTMGYRGDQYLMAGFVYLPYIPLFATPTLTTSDLMAQKGFMSASAFKVINPGMFCEGTISNLGTQTAG